MPDRIYIRDLLCRCIIGINPEERVKKQDVIINVTIEADLRAAAASDSMDHTIDYKGIKKRVIDLVESSSYYLIERLADRVALVCLEDARAERVCVRVDKPGALRFAKSVGVEIERSRADLE